jgi:hypothetical protein
MDNSSNTLPSNLPTRTVSFEGKDIQVINVCDVLDTLYGTDWPSYETTSKGLQDFCATHNVHYYARPHEDFSSIDAIVEAADAGFSVVVLEDLS